MGGADADPSVSAAVEISPVPVSSVPDMAPLSVSPREEASIPGCADEAAMNTVMISAVVFFSF